MAKDYLGKDQRKTNNKEAPVKEENIKGLCAYKLLQFSKISLSICFFILINLFILALDEAEIQLLKSYAS